MFADVAISSFLFAVFSPKLFVCIAFRVVASLCCLLLSLVAAVCW